MSIVAQLRQLTVSFAGKTIVHDLSLDIHDRQITVLIGRSGSGKTTLLRALNRLNEEFPDCVTQGQIALDLGDGLAAITGSAAPPLTVLRRQVGMVFQTPNVLPVSIWRNVALPLEKLTTLPAPALRQRVEKSLQDVGLWHEVSQRLHQPADRLSGGQQQRLCLARTLALEPRILLLDEPTASLDIIAAREIEQLLLQLAERYAIVMVSHSLSQARRLAQRLLVLDSGQLVKSLNPQDDLSDTGLAALMALF